MATTVVQFSTISTQCCSRTAKSPNNNFLFYKTNNITTRLFSSCKLVTHQSETSILKFSQYRRPVLAISDHNEAELSSESQRDRLQQEPTIDIQLPKRSLLVQFTCNACDVRTERLINRVAYETGTVYVQCAGCLKHHQLVDNLNLVREYIYQDDLDAGLNNGR